MLPIARVVYPDDFVQCDLQSMRLRNSPQDLGQWPGLERLHERALTSSEDYINLADEELVHPFDREMNTNQFLKNPKSEGFKPWDCFKTPVQLSEYQEVMRSTVDHFYGYWQVHQLYLIQQYPDLYRNKVLLDHIPKDVKKKILRPCPPEKRRGELSIFEGKEPYFNALSFWITTYRRENERTFAHVSEKHNVRRLDDEKYKHFRERVERLAKSVQCRFDLTVDNLYKFLFNLTDLYEKYRHEERFKLADEVREDIFHLSRLIEGITGDSWEAIADELGQRYHLWARQTFRHLDIATKEWDDAHFMLCKAVKVYCKDLKGLKITTRIHEMTGCDIERLLDYCEKEGHAILITALGGMAASEDEREVKFRNVARYSNLKNVLSSLEYLLKDFASRGGITLDGNTLTSVVKKVMKEESGWIPLFNKKVCGGCTRANNPGEFLKHLNALLCDPELVKSEDAFLARAFLITCLARNGTIHHYLTNDWYYGDLFGKMLNSAIFAISYSWLLAKGRKLVGNE